MLNMLKRLASSDQTVRRNELLNLLREMDTPFIHYRDSVRHYRPENIIVRFGNDALRYVIGAHYDSIPGSTGANDNAASVCILLEMIRLYLQTPPEFAVDFVFFDLEEMAMQGSQAYLSHVKPENIKSMINFDLCGVGDVILAAVHRETDIGEAAGEIEKSGKYKMQIIQTLPPSDDMIFEHTRIPTMSVCAVPEHDVAVIIESAPIIHQQGIPAALPTLYDTMHNRERDSIEVVEAATMQTVLNFGLDLVKSLEKINHR